MSPIGSEPWRIYICAGEASGDMHAAALMRALRTVAGRPVLFRGFGGDAMRAEGAELLYHTDQTAIMGITPVLAHAPFLWRLYRHVGGDIQAWRPHLVITVDYPGMNIRLAALAKKHHFKTVHYICPKVWAWNRGRIPRLARIFDQMLCILPFEPPLFEQTNLQAEFTGHPLVDRAAETRAETPLSLPWQGTHRIALLPGSRASEITRILPRLLAAAVLLERKLDGDCSFMIPVPTPGMRQLNEAVITRAALKPRHLALVDGQARQVLLQAQAAAVASGTATLEACLMECPTLLVYRVSWATYWVARWLIKGVKFVGLANIIAGREVMPELLQQQFTADEVAKRLYTYLTDQAARARCLSELAATNRLLGSGAAALRAAQAIVQEHFKA